MIITTLMLALQVGVANPVRHPEVWTDPIQTNPAYDSLPTGPYNMVVQPLNQPRTFYSVDNENLFESGMSWDAYFAPMTSLSTTMYRTDLIGYRTAWYVTRLFEQRDPACYCWHNLQNTMYHLMGLDTVFDPDVLREATEWYDRTGQYSNWGDVFVVTDKNLTRMEYITGTLVEITPTPPEPPTQVPEPASWALVLAGAAGMLFLTKRRHYGS